MKKYEVRSKRWKVRKRNYEEELKHKDTQGAKVHEGPRIRAGLKALHKIKIEFR